MLFYWDGTNDSKTKVPDGLYFHEIMPGNGTKISGKIQVSKY
jgi:flagellar hook assembly protein FlgD